MDEPLPSGASDDDDVAEETQFSDGDADEEDFGRKTTIKFSLWEGLLRPPPVANDTGLSEQRRRVVDWEGRGSSGYSTSSPPQQRTLETNTAKTNSAEIRKISDLVGPDPENAERHKLWNFHLRPQQQNVCRLVVDSKDDSPRLLVFHSTGSGKTLTALAACMFFIKSRDLKSESTKIYFVLPLSNRNHAQEQMDKFALDMNGVRVEPVTGDGFRKIDPSEFPVNTLLVIDEAHEFADPWCADRNWGIPGRRTKEKSYHLMQLTQHRNVKLVLLLTATPVHNFKSEFLSLFCILTKRERRRQIAECLEELKRDDYAKLSGRISFHDRESSSDASLQYPTETSEVQIVELSGSCLREYNEVERRINSPTVQEMSLISTKTLVENEERGQYSERDLKRMRAFLMELRRVPCVVGAKVQVAHDVASRSVEAGERLLIYTFWVGDVVAKLKTKFDSDPSLRRTVEYITGETKDTRRDEIVKKFGPSDKSSSASAEPLVLVISRAGALSIDLHEIRTVLIMEPHWNEELIKQIRGRAVRLGSHAKLEPDKRTVTVIRLQTRKAFSNSDKKFEVDGMGAVQVTDRGDSSVVAKKTADEYIGEMAAEKEIKLSEFFGKLRAVSDESSDRSQPVVAASATTHTHSHT
jgi:superfamily II DNA or RNA helicase